MSGPVGGTPRRESDPLVLMAHAELARRSASAGLGQLFLFAVFAFASSFFRDHVAAGWLLGAVLVVFNLLRVYLGGRCESFSRLSWERAFFAAFAFPALAWGAIFFLTLEWYGLTRFTTLLAMLIGSGISAASTTSLSPSRFCSHVFLTLTLGLPFLALVSYPDRQSGEVALIFVAYYVFLWKQGEIQNSIFWAGLRSREELARESGRLKAVLDAIPGGVCWINGDLKIQGVNESYASFFGGNAGEYLGMPLSFRNGNERFHELVREFIDSPRTAQATELQLSCGPERRWHLIVMRKSETEVYLVCVDIHELRTARAKLEQQKSELERGARLALLGNVALDISHEIRNPLAATMMTIDLIKRKCAGATPESVAALADRAHLACSRIEKIIDGLTRFSGTAEETPFVVTSLTQLVREAADFVERQYAQCAVPLVVELPKEDLYIRCRPAEIIQVLVNVLTNALHAAVAQKEKWVRVGFEPRGSDVAILFMDSGHGIRPEVAEKLFTRYFTTKPAGKGTGLGLSISKRIIEDHHGRIELDPGRINTTFVVSLPLADAEARRKERGDLRSSA